MKVFVKPDELWAYFQKNKGRLEKECDEVADVSDDTDSLLVSVYLTSEKGYPAITIEQVLDNGEEKVLEKECAISEDDCRKVYTKILQKAEEYGEKFSVKVETQSSVDDTDIEIVAEREAELREALATFLNVFMGLGDTDEICFADEELTEILNEFESMMFNSFGYCGYRPQIIEENGQMKLIDFPFDEEDPYGE